MSPTTFLRLRHRPMVLPDAKPVETGETAARSRGRGWVIASAVFVGLMLLADLIGGPVARSLLNRRLAAGPGFIGRMEHVDLTLWRAEMEVGDLALYTRGHVSDGPMLHVKKAFLSLSPFALLTGKRAGRVTIDGAELNFIKREDQARDEIDRNRAANVDQAGRTVRHWQDAVAAAFPIALTRLEVKNARVHFLDRTKQPNPALALEQLHLVATGLQNRPQAGGDPLPARVLVDGVTTGRGQLHAEVRADPLARQPHFTASFEIRRVNLPDANAFLLANADADVSRGTFEVFVQADARDGSYRGYVKPLLHDLDFRNASDRDKNAAQHFAGKVAGSVASVLKSDDKNQVATKATFSGSFSANEVDLWTTIAELFRHAFVQALRGGFEHRTPNR